MLLSQVAPPHVYSANPLIALFLAAWPAKMIAVLIGSAAYAAPELIRGEKYLGEAVCLCVYVWHPSCATLICTQVTIKYFSPLLIDMGKPNHVMHSVTFFCAYHGVEVLSLQSTVSINCVVITAQYKRSIYKLRQRCDLMCDHFLCPPITGRYVESWDFVVRLAGGLVAVR